MSRVHPWPRNACAAALLVLAAACGASSSGGSPAEPSDAGDAGVGSIDERDAEPDAATAQPRSCDPLTPREPAPELLVGPNDFEKRVLAEIAGANASIHVLVYEIDRKSVIDALISAKKRGVDVRLVVDRTQSAPAKDTLRAAGIDVKDSPAEFTYAHVKTMLVDDRRALILSGNLNDYTFESERNYGVVDDDPSDVADVAAVFARDYAGSGNVDVSCTKLLVAPLNARARIEALLKTATKSLDLTVMYVTDPAMVAAMKDRKAAGVALRVLLADPSWISSNTQTAADLSAAGIPVRYFQKLDLHAKMIVADGARAFVGSENLSQNSLDDNRELGIIATEPTVVAGIRAQVEQDWNAGIVP